MLDQASQTVARRDLRERAFVAALEQGLPERGARHEVLDDREAAAVARRTALGALDAGAIARRADTARAPQETLREDRGHGRRDQVRLDSHLDESRERL